MNRIMDQRLRNQILHVALLSLGAVTALYAQDPPDKGARRENPPAPFDKNAPGIGYVSAEFRFGGKVVKNAPYSAEAVTESTQALANGTRLSQKSVALIYRDGEGRTRREQSGAPVGPFATAGPSQRVIFISDPVAGVAFTLYPDTRTATRASLPFAEIIDAANPHAAPPPPPAHGERKAPPTIPPLANDSRQRQDQRQGQGQPPPRERREPNGATVISLGKRTIEGLPSDGERVTTTIPVNSIGNDQPIEIVEERWKSPDLRTTLWSKTSDPRWGETTYQLTKIKRGEPDAALFAVPTDYVIKDAQTGDPKPKAGKRKGERPVR